MYDPEYKRFCALAEQGNVIPVYREHLADMETPVSAFSRFADDPYAFLLESVEGGERWGRYSIIGVHPRRIFTVHQGCARLTDSSGTTLFEDPDNGFLALRKIMSEKRLVPTPALPRFVGGAVGYLGYETVNEFENVPPPRESSSAPDSCFMLTDDLAVFDNVRHTVTVIACAHTDEADSLEAAYRDACARVEDLEKRLQAPAPTRHASAAPHPREEIKLESNLTQETFCNMVKKARQYVVDGDIIQAVLSQRFSTTPPAKPLEVYRALRLINPSPYTFCLKFNDHHLVGSSPEVMVRLNGRQAELRPIAGTRPRGGTEQEDRNLADELLADEKEKAEHVMLVDLGRNDLGRVATTGSVQAREFMTVERYSHVMHLVTHIQSELNSNLDAFDLLKATFPAGTLSGAPKVRAMEIINELEPAPRGPYGGAVGYIGYDGNMDTAITIRTVEMNGEQAHVQAGAGIVFDSDPEKEYEETVNKARGLVKALELAANNLDLTAS